MEDTTRLDDNTEYLCGICTNSFRGDALIPHLTEHTGITDNKHTHFLWCKLCSPLLRNSDSYVDDTEFSNEVVITENYTAEIPLDVMNPYIFPEGLNYLANDNYEPVNLQNDYLNCAVPQLTDHSYSSNKFLYPVYSYSVNDNYDALVTGGLTYFLSRFGTNYSGESFQYQEEVANPENDADVARIEPSLNSTCNENSCVETDQQALRDSAQQTDSTIVETDQQTLGDTQQKDYSQQIDAPIVETKQAQSDDTQQIDATHAEPCPEGTNEVPSSDNVKTQPDTAEVGVILDSDISEVANTLNESSISKSSNAKFQPYTSNSNRKLNKKNASRTVSFTLKNLRGGSSTSGYNSCEHANNEDCKSVSEYVVNNGSKSQNCDSNFSNDTSRRSNRQAKSSKNYGNANIGRVGCTGLHFKYFNSTSDCPSSNDIDSHSKRRYDRNNNGLGNRNNLRSNPSSNVKSNFASNRASSSIRNGSNVTSNTHYNNSGDKSEGQSSGASSEVPKSNVSYSAAVKRSMN